jgi:TonB-dependent receptor
VQQTRTWVAPSYGSLRANWDRLRQTYYGATGNPSFDPVAHFDANERSWAGYGQMHYAVGPADHPIDGVLGLRVVRTRESITGNVVSGATVTPRTTTSEYTDYLPTLNARYRFTPELQLRLSANKTRTRPDLNQLNPGVFVPPNPGSSGRFEVTAGNVDLRPFVSKNYDAALEYYFSRTGFAALSIFRHDVSGFIANQTVNVDINVNGAPVALRLTQPVNLNKTTIQGAEAQLTTFFDYGFVPEWVHPFGVQLNATYLDAHLSNISRYAYNVVGMYERGGLAARLTYNLRTRFAQDEPGLFADDVSRLDFSTNYTPPQFPNLTFAFDVSNILGKPFRNFFNYGQGVYPRDVRFEEAVYSVGIRFRR